MKQILGVNLWFSFFLASVAAADDKLPVTIGGKTYYAKPVPMVSVFGITTADPVEDETETQLTLNTSTPQIERVLLRCRPEKGQKGDVITIGVSKRDETKVAELHQQAKKGEFNQGANIEVVVQKGKTIFTGEKKLLTITPPIIDEMPIANRQLFRQMRFQLDFEGKFQWWLQARVEGIGYLVPVEVRYTRQEVVAHVLACEFGFQNKGLYLP